jgi:hypothetical protein
MWMLRGLVPSLFSIQSLAFWSFVFARRMLENAINITKKRLGSNREFDDQEEV